MRKSLGHKTGHSLQFSGAVGRWNGPGSGKVDECADLIRKLLAAGPLLADKLQAQCKAAGFDGVYRRARKVANVAARKSALHGGWVAVIEDEQPVQDDEF